MINTANWTMIELKKHYPSDYRMYQTSSVGLRILVILFVLGTVAQLLATSDSIRLISHLDDDSLSNVDDDWEWRARLHRDIPSDYLALINDLTATSDTKSSFASSTVTWVDYTKHQIASDPEGLSNTERILTEIQRAGRFFARLDGSNLLSIPFGIRGRYGELDYHLGFNNLRLYPEYASIDMVASIFIPVLGDTLVFAGADIKYNNRTGFLGEVRLLLVEDFVMEVNERKTAVILRRYRETSQVGTYLTISCEGVEKISLGMDVLFNSDFIRPVDPRFSEVQAFAQVDYRPESGLIISDLSIAPFYFKDFEEAAFVLENLTIDLDEMNNRVPYLDDYLSQLNDQGMGPGVSRDEWTGLYCESFKLIVGKNFLTRNDGKAIAVEGKNIIIDDLGFTAALNIQERLFGLEEANAAGWAISIEELKLDIFANQMKNFGFGGLIHVPILDKKKVTNKIFDEDDEVTTGPAQPANSLAYRARYMADSASLDLTITQIDSQVYAIPVFFGDIIIKQGSYLQLTTGDNLKIAAYINGLVSFRGELNGEFSNQNTLAISDILFEGLYISNRAPFLEVKSIHPVKGDTSKLGRFLFTFDFIALDDYKSDLYQGQLKRLHFNGVKLDLGAITDGDALVISSNINIYFAISSMNGRQKWIGKDFEIEKFGFEGTLPGIDYVKGELIFFRKDPTYGSGFLGSGTVRFGFVDTPVSMVCMFGTTGNAGFQYSYVDAAVKLSQTRNDRAFQVKMLMAGFHKNMARSAPATFRIGAYGMDNLNEILPGGQFPENRFIPSLDSWGIDGGLVAQVGDGAILGVRVVYERHLSLGQGMAYRFLFEGLIELMPRDEESPVEKRLAGQGEVPGSVVQKTPEEFYGKGTIGGYIRIQVIRDQVGKTFEAAFGIHGAAGGVAINFYGEYYKSPDNWHLFVGKPDNRLKIGYSLINSDVVDANLAINAYFMIGNSEAMPKVLPIPYTMSEANQSNLRIAYDSLVSNPATNIYQNNRADLSAGRVLAFGAGLGLEVSLAFPESKPWFFVEAGADIGFDLLLSRNAPPCYLENVSATGINGWYLYGQMYAGVTARIGIIIKNRTLKIFEGGAYVLLQGAAFNPTWAVGTWRFNYQLLFLKGEAQGIFKFGQPCQDVNVSFNPDKILNQIYPSRPVSEGGEGKQPIVVGINSDFRMDFVLAADRKIGQSLTDFNTGLTENFYIRLVSELKMLNQDEMLISGNILFDHDGTTLIFRPQQMLNPGDQLTLYLKATIYDDHGIYSMHGKTFFIDTMVNYLVDRNGISGLHNEDVAVSYPMIDQQYFHPDEYDQMMISFGKPLPLENVSLTSHLLTDKNGTYEEINTNILEVNEIGLVQSIFPNLKTASNYQWVIRATKNNGEVSDIANINFSTSRYRTFSEKAKTLHIPDFSMSALSQADSVLMLVVTADEPLEFDDGNIITGFIAGKNLEGKDAVSKGSGGGKVKDITSAPEQAGRLYLTRFQSTFSREPGYPYFSLIYDDYLPYGNQSIVTKCYVDDSPEAQQNADPKDKTQHYTMFGWTDKLLGYAEGRVQYDVIRHLVIDHRQFLKLAPAVPSYYAYCEPYSKGYIPYYIMGKYPLRIRYFIPGFEQYSSSNLISEFNLVP